MRKKKSASGAAAVSPAMSWTTTGGVRIAKMPTAPDAVLARGRGMSWSGACVPTASMRKMRRQMMTIDILSELAQFVACVVAFVDVGVILWLAIEGAEEILR